MPKPYSTTLLPVDLYCGTAVIWAGTFCLSTPQHFGTVVETWGKHSMNNQGNNATKQAQEQGTLHPGATKAFCPDPLLKDQSPV